MTTLNQKILMKENVIFTWTLSYCLLFVNAENSLGPFDFRRSTLVSLFLLPYYVKLNNQYPWLSQQECFLVPDGEPLTILMEKFKKFKYKISHWEPVVVTMLQNQILSEEKANLLSLEALPVFRLMVQS